MKHKAFACCGQSQAPRDESRMSEQSHHLSQLSSHYLPNMNRQDPTDNYELSSVNSAEAMVSGCVGSKKHLRGTSGPERTTCSLSPGSYTPCADVANKMRKKAGAHRRRMQGPSLTLISWPKVILVGRVSHNNYLASTMSWQQWWPIIWFRRSNQLWHVKMFSRCSHNTPTADYVPIRWSFIKDTPLANQETAVGKYSR